MKSTLLLSAVALCAFAGATTLLSAAPSNRQTIATGSLGKGTVTVWQQSDRVGVTIDRLALDSLPQKQTRVDLVTKGSSPFPLVEIDWNPMGHPPKGVYTVPHIDAHFYVIGKDERDAIGFGAPGSAAKPTPDRVPAGFITDGTVVPQMGLHYVPKAAPEFNGKPFTCTQILGYNNGHFAFYEAMFTLAFIKAHGSFAESLARPSHVAADKAAQKLMVASSRDGGGYDVIIEQ